MQFSGIDYISILAAAAAGFVTGAVWYTVLGKAWLAALGKTREQLGPSFAPFAVVIVADIVMAWMLAGILGHLGEVTIRNGVISAFFVWLGFVITTMAVNHAFGGARRMLTLIDGGHWLAVLLVMGLVLGAFG